MNDEVDLNEPVAFKTSPQVADRAAAGHQSEARSESQGGLPASSVSISHGFIVLKPDFNRERFDADIAEFEAWWQKQVRGANSALNYVKDVAQWVWLEARGYELI